MKRRVAYAQVKFLPWLDHTFQYFPFVPLQPQINQALHNEAVFVASNAMRAGRSPAEAMYGMAKSWGYSGSQQPADDPAAAQKKAGDVKMGALQRGAAAATSLDGAGGREPDGVTPEVLADMDDNQFDEWWGKVMSG